MVDFSKICLLALDFDGVLTNNKVIVDENGKESVICNRSDGLGIDIIKKKGIEVIVISKEQNKVVKARCDKLKIKEITPNSPEDDLGFILWKAELNRELSAFWKALLE